jgi:hypothetical protein
VAVSARLYSLFETRGFRYHRISPLSYTKPVAVHVFQGHLLDGALGGRITCLRPVEDSWQGNERIYKPPVEKFEQLHNRSTLDRINHRTATEPLPDNVTVEKTANGREVVIVKPVSKGYRTPQKAVRA